MYNTLKKGIRCRIENTHELLMRIKSCYFLIDASFSWRN